MPDFLQIAKSLIERGFSVIPIESSGKRPVRGIGALQRTRMWSQVFAWSQSYGEDLNVAICADENIVILETDDIEALTRAVQNGAGQSLPLTLMACGSSTNRPHFFFGTTQKCLTVGNLVVPGLFEARFKNQYVVAPGSLHPSGCIYRWLNDCPIAPIPDFLVSELARLALSQKNLHEAPRRIETVGGRIPEGSRHYFLMRELGRMWDGTLSEEEMLTKAFELNEQCDPPKEAVHVRQCVCDIMRREPFDPGPTVIVGGAVTEEKKTINSGEWVSVSATELTERNVPARQAIMTENEAVLFYESSVNQILAWRGVGKTNFALGLAGAIAAGGAILNFKTDRPRRVLYIDGELPLAQLQERVKMLVPPEHRDIIQLFSPELLPSPRGLNLVTNGDFTAMQRLIEKNGTEVLFIDSQSTTMVGDSLKTEFQEARLQVLRALRWMGLCIIEMHHVGKGGFQRGLSRNDDVLDVQISLKKMDGWEPEDGLQFELVYEKVRHAARLESGYTVTMDNGVWSKRPSDSVAAAAELYNKGLSDREVGKKLKVSHGTANALRRKAIKAGLVHTTVETNINGIKSKPKGE